MIETYLHAIKDTFDGKVYLHPRREGLYQVMLPIFYEDGDMVDVYIQDSPQEQGKIRICDCGMTIMRLSYTYDINTPAREKIFSTILTHNGVCHQEGELYLDSEPACIYQRVMQFIGCQQKVYNMQLWQHEVTNHHHKVSAPAPLALAHALEPHHSSHPSSAEACYQDEYGDK